jgi:xanthine dehydrogenase YagR molybdenum-binding subunit
MSEPLAAPSITEIGKARTRIDGPLKVTGTARYASDHSFPNMLYAVPVGATIAKGKIKPSIRLAHVKCPACAQS